MVRGVDEAVVNASERRRSARQSVLKRANLIAGEQVYDCVVLDSSASGARVSTGSFVSLPDGVELRFPSGASLQAAIRWSRGAEIGLEFVAEGASLRDQAAELAWSSYEQLRDGRLDKAVRILRTENFFDDPTLRVAALEAEEAYARLEAALRQRAQGTVRVNGSPQNQISWW
jgi:hypothetical protein